jgi:Undecaprenyl-phosphate glucose phosphotransferase
MTDVPSDIRRAEPSDPAAPISPVIVKGLVKLAEWCVIVIAGAAVHAAYLSDTPAGSGAAYAALIGAGATLAVLVFHWGGSYALAALRAPWSRAHRLLLGWGFVLLLMLAAIFFLKLEGVFSRVFMAAWFVGGYALLLAERNLVGHLVKGWTRQGRLARRTAIVGGGRNAEALLERIRAQGSNDLRVLGVFDDRTDERSPDSVAGYPKLGRVADLVDYARGNKVDLVIFTLPITAESRVLAMMKTLSVLPVDIRLSAHANQLKFKARNYSYVGDVPVLDMADRPMADWDVVLKWLFDRVVGALMLIALSPVMLATALAVRLDSRGPILFRQKRYGFNNELIEVYKFRSMYVDMSDVTASRLVTKDDPRVTRVGRFIRKTSLDELPQLFNVVFKGDLSLIGPRPHAVHAKAANRLYDEVVDGYFARHKVKPGITGWAQINGWRGETDTQEKIQKRVDYDLEYIENWSIWFDLYILLKTPFALAKTENAY